MSAQLKLPPHYNAQNAFDPTFRVKSPRAIMDQAAQWAKENHIAGGATDKKRVRLLVIDPQFDFSFGDGSLFVGGRSGKGAMEDAARTAEFIYRNLKVVTSVTCTLDTHHPYQVFYPSAHMRRDGSHPDTWGNVTVEDYASGTLQANPAMAAQLGISPTALTRQFLHYCEELAKSDRYSLTLWPEHCMLGDHGHQIAGAINEARYFHSYARGVTNELEVKGSNPLTENYSIFKPEVTTLWNGQPIPGAQKNLKLIKLLVEDSDAVVICGEAMSHCLAWSVHDLIDEIFTVYDPKLAGKLYVMEDCTSPVVVPGVVDHTDAALAAFDDFRNRGVHVVRSTDPFESWPGVAEEIAASVA